MADMTEHSGRPPAVGLSPTEQRTTPLAVEDIEPQSCTVDLRVRLLRQLPFFAGLSDAQVDEVNHSFHEQGFAAGGVIYPAGDPATHLYVVASGKAKPLRHTFAGQDVLLDMLGQDEFFGSMSALGDDVYPDTGQPQGDRVLITDASLVRGPGDPRWNAGTGRRC
jgi:hypothetical protein